jgi:hypothetical protein
VSDAKKTLQMVKAKFPRLNNSHVKLTSPNTSQYNCIAWAAGFSDRWFWPSPNYYWPAGIPVVATEAAFEAAYKTLGFEKVEMMENDAQTADWIAIFVQGKFVTHASRLLPNGFWTSKLGPGVDIEHSLNGLEGSEYGTVAFFMKRLKTIVSDSV